MEKDFQLTEDNLSIVEDLGEHMPGGFFIYKAEQPEELIYANQACIDIFGCRNKKEFKELTGNTFRGMLYKEDYDKISESIADQLDTNDDNMDYVEYRIVRKDGKLRWVDDYGHYTETKAFGGIYYVFISDITEKHEERERDKEIQKAVFRSLTNSYHTVWLINDVETEECSLYHTDMDEAHAEAIRNALSHAKYTDAKTEYVNTMVAEEDRERMQEQISFHYILEQFKTKNQFSINFIRDLEAGPRYYRIDFAKVKMPGGKTGVTMGFRDVDEEARKQLAVEEAERERNAALEEALGAAEQASKAKTAFLSNMSHEIRTPMNAIIGLNDLALNEPDVPDKVRDYLTKIGASAQHLLSIINDILDMSRIESGRTALKNEEFSFIEGLEQINTIIGGQCREKGLTYECKTVGKIDDSYVGDGMKLRQILINILGNAVKFTPEGGTVSLTVEEGKRYKGKATLKFIIEDNGIGMSKEYLPTLFDPFTQEDSSTTSKYGSTGLGMPLTKRMVDLMNGRIDVESEKGKGTVFTVRLTFGEAVGNGDDQASSHSHEEKPDAEVKEIDKETAELSRADLKGRRILLAEDMEVNAEIMVMVLKMREIEADVAVNGRIAVEKYIEHPDRYYDAILMDMRMPEMDGLEATRIIRASGKGDAKDIPIIALTANAFDEDVQRSLQAGLNAHLSKPVEPESLFDTLERLIRLSRSCSLTGPRFSLL